MLKDDRSTLEMIVVPEHRARAGHPNSTQSVELLSRAAKARIFRQRCAAPVSAMPRPRHLAWPKLQRLGMRRSKRRPSEVRHRRLRS